MRGDTPSREDTRVNSVPLVSKVPVLQIILVLFLSHGNHQRIRKSNEDNLRSFVFFHDCSSLGQQHRIGKADRNKSSPLALRERKGLFAHFQIEHRNIDDGQTARLLFRYPFAVAGAITPNGFLDFLRLVDGFGILIPFAIAIQATQIF